MDEEELKKILNRPVPARFHQTMEGLVAIKAEPVTEAELQESAEIWDMIKGKGTTKGKKVNPDK